MESYELLIKPTKCKKKKKAKVEIKIRAIPRKQ